MVSRSINSDWSIKMIFNFRKPSSGGGGGGGDGRAAIVARRGEGHVGLCIARRGCTDGGGAGCCWNGYVMG